MNLSDLLDGLLAALVTFLAAVAWGCALLVWMV